MTNSVKYGVFAKNNVLEENVHPYFVTDNLSSLAEAEKTIGDMQEETTKSARTYTIFSYLRKTKEYENILTSELHDYYEGFEQIKVVD